MFRGDEHVVVIGCGTGSGRRRAGCETDAGRSCAGGSVGGDQLRRARHRVRPPAAAVEGVIRQPGFILSYPFTGLEAPTAVRFAPDGRVFVAEKGGKVKAFDSLTDDSASVAVDVSGNTHDYWDRGLLGFEVDPNWTTAPYVYLMYTLDPGDSHHDDCANPTPRFPDDGVGCPVNGRISRFRISPTNTVVGGEQVLLEGRWCQQFPSHSVGTLAFDEHRRLLASGGDGASFRISNLDVDTGQYSNVCHDPMNGPTKYDDEGGSFRAQDLLTGSDPVGYNGSVIRIDPDTGAAASGNPAGDPETARILATGLRNPFRLTPAPRHERDLDRRRRPVPMGGDQPPRRSRRHQGELRLAVHGGRELPDGGGEPLPRLRHVRTPQRRRRRPGEHHQPALVPHRHAAVLHVRALAHQSDRPRSTAAAGSRRRSRAWRSTRRGPTRTRTTGRCSWPTTPGSASGRCCPAPTACPTATPSSRSCRASIPPISSAASAVTSSSPTWHVGRSAGSRTAAVPTRRPLPRSVPTSWQVPSRSPCRSTPPTPSTPTATRSRTRGISTATASSVTPPGALRPPPTPTPTTWSSGSR